MNTRQAALSSVTALLLAATVFQTPVKADEQIAKELEAQLSESTGGLMKPGEHFSVTFEGDNYRILYNTDTFRELLAMADIDVRFDGEFGQVMTPTGGDRWSLVEVMYPAIEVAFEEAGERSTFEYAFKGPIEISGIYNAATGLYEYLDHTVAQITSSSKAEGMESTSTQTNVRYRLTSTVTDTDAVDIEVNGTAESFSQDTVLGGGLLVTLTGEGASFDVALQGFVKDPLIALIAFAVENGQKNALSIAAREKLLALIGDTIPLFELVSESGEIETLSLRSPFGSGTLSDIGGTFEMTGLVDDASIRMAFGFDGLDLAAHPLPAWAVELLPQAVEIEMVLDNYDLESPVRYILAEVDPHSDDPLTDEIGLGALALLLPDGTVEVGLTALSLESDAYSLEAEGTLVVTPQEGEDEPAVEGSMEVTMEGLDNVVNILQAQADTDPQVQEAMLGIIFMKGLAQTNADGAAVWNISVDADETVVINGQQLSP